MDDVENLRASGTKISSPLQNRTSQKNVLQPSTKHNVIQSPKLSVGKVSSPKPADLYASIRGIDDAERWVERTSIITKQDHESNVVYAGEILEEIVQALTLKKDEMDIKSSDYNIDFDKLDELSTPFGTTKQLCNSPLNKSILNEEEKAKSLTDVNGEDKSAFNTTKELSPSTNSKLEIDFTNDANDEPISDMIIKSSGYNIDFDKLDELSTPFGTTKQLCNSPPVKEPVSPSKLDSLTPSKSMIGVCASNQVEESCDVKVNPFETKNQLTNSPIIYPVLSKQEHHHQNNSALDMQDKSSQSSVEVANDSTMIIPSGLEIHIGDDTSASGLIIDLNSIDASQSNDPFKPGKQIVNSPVQKDIPASEGTISENFNPFHTLTKVQNSPSLAPSRGEGDTLNKSIPNEEKAKSITNVTGEDKTTVSATKELSSLASPTNSKLEIDFTNDANDEPISEMVIKSSGYNIDFDKLDELSTPFGTSKQLCNSPPVKEPVSQSKLDSLTPSKSMILDCGSNQVKESVEMNPFETKNQVTNSPTIQPQLSKQEHHHQNNSALDMPDKSSQNTVEVTNGSTKIISPGLQMHFGGDTSPSGFTIDLNSIDESQSNGPFNSSNQIVNSPVPKDSLAAKGTYSFDDIGENLNPFQPLQQMCNSPVAVSKPLEPENTCETTCLKEETKVTPDIESDPFETKTQIPNTPPKSNILFTLDIEDDPFESKTKIANSPVTGVAETKTKKAVVEKTEAKVDLSLDPLNVCLPPTEAISHSVEVENPFQTKSTIANSPAKSPSRHVHFETPAENAVQKTLMTDNDPFKSKSQVMNSPTALEKSPGSLGNKSHLSPEVKPQWQNANSISKIHQMSTSPLKKAISDSGKSPKLGSAKKKSPTRNSPNRSPSRSASAQKKEEENTPPPPIRGRRKLSEGPSPTLPGSANVSIFDDISNPFDSTQLNSTIVTNPQGSEMTAICPFLQQQLGLEEEFDDNSFIPASEVFNNPAFNDPAIWDMLEKAGSGEDKESALARMSLYVKFDPLVKAPKQAAKTSPEFHRLSHAGALLGNRPLMKAIIERDEDDNLLGTPTRTKVNSLLSQINDQRFSSRPDLMGEVDHIFSCSPNVETATNPMPSILRSEENQDLVQVLQYSEADIKKLRTELELGFQSQILIKEKQWHTKLLEVKREEEIKQKELLNEIKDAKKRELTLEATLREHKLIMTDYEKTISQVLGDKEKSSETLQKSMEEAVLAKEKAEEELAEVENLFSKLTSRYEKVQAVVSKQNQNEELFKKGFAEQKAKLETVAASYKSLKLQAAEKLSRASEELEKTHKIGHAEMAKLKAALKKRELQVEGLESSLQQKIKENEQLTQICDELISKVD